MNNYEKSRAIAAATARIAAADNLEWRIIRDVMTETGCSRHTAWKHLFYNRYPDTRPAVGGPGRKQGRKPGSQNKASQPA